VNAQDLGNAVVLTGVWTLPAFLGKDAGQNAPHPNFHLARLRANFLAFFTALH